MATKITGTVSGEPIIEYEVGGVFVPWKQGIQNWATVTAVTGSPTSGSYTDADGVEWKYYKWTSSGSVTTTAGIVDVFVISQGGGAYSGQAGAGGRFRDGIQSLSSGTHTVQVGGTSSIANHVGDWSGIGSIKSGMSPVAYGGNKDGASTDGAQATTGYHRGFTSSITGSAVEYGREGRAGSSRANTGDGDSTNNPSVGTGVAILRVPSTFAQA
jgi:hypothetical protein